MDRYLQRVDKEHCRLVYELCMKEALNMSLPFETLSYDDFEEAFDSGIFFFWRDEKDIYAVLDLSSIMAQPRSAQVGVVALKKGNGDGVNATLALFRYCFRSMGLHRLWCIINADNKPALAAVEKVPELRLEGKLVKSRFKEGSWVDQYVYAVLESEVE